MAVYQGTYFTASFSFSDKTTGTPVDITDWTFSADIRDARSDPAELASLTSENGGFAILDGPGGRFSMNITAEETAALPTGRMVFDVLRTDSDPGPVYIFGGSFTVKRPITR